MKPIESWTIPGDPPVGSRVFVRWSNDPDLCIEGGFLGRGFDYQGHPGVFILQQLAPPAVVHPSKSIRDSAEHRYLRFFPEHGVLQFRGLGALTDEEEAAAIAGLLKLLENIE